MVFHCTGTAAAAGRSVQLLLLLQHVGKYEIESYKLFSQKSRSFKSKTNIYETKRNRKFIAQHLSIKIGLVGQLLSKGYRSLKRRFRE